MPLNYWKTSAKKWHRKDTSASAAKPTSPENVSDVSQSLKLLEYFDFKSGEQDKSGPFT